MTPQNPQRTKRFAIGLSFPEAYRKKVQAIADCLTEVFPKESILYDGYHEAELARPSKDTYLQDLFKNQTGLVVVFLCHAYHEEEWCGLEWRAIRARMNAKDTSSIMLLQLDEGTPDGFFGNVDGYVDISRKSDSEVADLIVERLRLNKSEVNHITYIETDSYAELRKYLSQWLTDRRKEHPSFRLMEIDDELFPDCIPEYYNISAIDDSGETKSVAEIISQSWRKQKNNHLMIEGEGGIGKTVTLLSLPEKFVPHPVPAVYVQLHELQVVKKEETIEEFIERKMFSGKKELFQQFLRLAGEEWDNGPMLLLLLDGFNEIVPEKRFTIGQDINDWAERPGVQIITSSRFDIHSYVPLGGGYGRILLQPLSRETIKHYLDRLDLPQPTTDSQWKILDFPLLLTLYAQTERALRNLNKDEIQEFRESKNAGAIIWNYLQRELWRFRKHPEEVVKCILATEVIAPFIAWQMQKEGAFFIDKGEFKRLIKEACAKACSMDPDQFPPHVSALLDKFDLPFPRRSDITAFLEKELHLFVWRGNVYSLMHQHFRDALAAMHLINVSYATDDLPQEWKEPVDYYVLNFVAELASKEEADNLWERNRTASSTMDSTIINMLELQKRKRNYDFTELNFSGMDFSSLSLFPYRVPESFSILLPHNRALNKGLSLSKQSLLPPQSHTDSINAIAITPDGRICVSGSQDTTLRVWDLAYGRCLFVLKKHPYPITALAISPDGKRCISSSSIQFRGSIIYVWDLETGECILTLEEKLNIYVTSLMFSPDGKRCISSSNENTLRVWDLETGKSLHFLKSKDFIKTLAVSPEGERCVCGSYHGPLSVWNLETEKRILNLEGHHGYITALAITPDGKRCISGSNDKTLRVWNLDSGECLFVLKGHDGSIHSLAITPDGKHCISEAFDKTQRVWDLETGRCLTIMKEHLFPDCILAITPDGKRSISGSDDGTVRIRDLMTGNCLHTLGGHKGAIKALAVTHDGKKCVSGSDDKTLRVWDLETGGSLYVREGRAFSTTAVAITPDGEKSITGSTDALRVWDSRTGACLHIVEGGDGFFSTLAVSPSSGKCVSGGYDHKLRVWDLLKGICLQVLDGHQGMINTLAFTLDGRKCISGSADLTLRIWDMETGDCLHVLRGHKSSITEIIVTPDGKRCVCKDRDMAVRVWEIETGKCLQILEGPEGFFRSLFITSDGEKCISHSSDGKCRIWDLKSGNCLHIQDMLWGDYLCAVSPDGKTGISKIYVHKKTGISKTYDHIYQVWNLETGERTCVLEEERAYLDTIVICPDGRRCISISDWEETMWVWDIKTGHLLKTFEKNHRPAISSSLTPDGNHFVIATDDRTISIIDLQDLTIIPIEILPFNLHHIDFSLSIIPDNLRETLRQNGAIV